MNQTLAIMFTMTTYGTWLRGDKRGWIDKGRLLPPNPELEDADRKRLKHPVFLFDPEQYRNVGRWIGHSFKERLDLSIFSLSVQSWHVHLLTAASEYPIEKIVKCAKDSVRWGLRPGRPIWTEHYDKRFCFDEESIWNRIEYVERHNTEIGLPAKPWDFIEMPNL
ncbi:MAG: hypothetical protein IT426_01275 [Pirellulales bacterium]|nr:hypothetical protein [Pirellulales bacterium]